MTTLRVYEMYFRTFFFTVLLGFGLPGLADEPDYVLRDYNGVEHRLSENRGKWTIMNFRATWCPPCLDEMPELSAFHAEHKHKDAVVWGISFEKISKRELQDFIGKVSVNYPILGFEQEPYTPFGSVRVLPTTFFIGPDGKFITKHEGTLSAEKIEAIIAEHASGDRT